MGVFESTYNNSKNEKESLYLGSCVCCTSTKRMSKNGSGKKEKKNTFTTQQVVETERLMADGFVIRNETCSILL